MANDIDIKLKLDGEREFKQAVKDCNSELKNMQSALKLVETETQGSANSVDSLRKKEEALNKVVEASKKKQEEIAKALENARQNREKAKQTLDELKKSETANKEEVEKAEKAYANAERSVTNWETQLNKAKTDTANANKELEKTEKYLKEAEDAGDDCAKSIDEYGKEVKDADKETKDFNKDINALTKMEAVSKVCETLAKAAKKVGDQLKDSASKFATFESSIAKISTIADPAQDLDDMSDAIQKLSRSMGVSATEISESVYQAISASVDTADAVEFVEKATRLAIGGFTDSTTAVDALTTTLNAYGLEMSDVDDISNTLIATQKLGKTSVGELAQNLGQVIPSAAAYGVELKDLSASYVTLTRSGINTANATTMLKSMFAELGKESSGVSKILKQQTGKSFAQLIDDGANLGDVIDVLSDSVNGDATAFANLWSNQRAGMGALAILNAGTEEYTSVINELTESEGLAEDAYESMANTAEYSGARMTAAADAFKTAIGESMQPVIEKTEELVTDMLNSLTDGFEELPDEAQKAIGVVALIGTTALQAAPQIAAFATQLATMKIAKSLAGDTTSLGTAVSSLGKFAVGAGITVGALAGIYAIVSARIKEATAEQREFLNAVEGSGAAYDSTHKRIQVLTEAENEYVTNEERLAELQALRASVVDTINKAEIDMAEAGKQLNPVMEQTNKLYEQATPIVGSTAEEMGTMKESTVEVTEGTKVLNEQQELLQKTYDAASGTYAQATSDLDAINAEIAELEAAEKAAAAATEEATEATENNIEATGSSAAEMAKLEAAMKASITTAGQEVDAFNRLSEYSQKDAVEIATAILDMKDSITSGIQSQIDWFDAVKEKSAQNVDDIAANLQAQIDDVKEWEYNLAYLADQGINKSLLQYLADLGPDGSEYVKAFVAAANGETETGLEEMNALWEEKLDLEAGINKEAEYVYEGIGILTAGSVDKMDNMAELLNAAAWDSGENVALGMAEGIKAAMDQPLEAAEDMGEETVEAAAEGAEVESPSKATKRTGEFIGQGLRDGINKTVNMVTQAAKNLAKQAIEGITGTATADKTKASGESLGRGVVEGIKSVESSLSGAISGMDKSVQTGLSNITETIKNAFSGMTSEVSGAWTGINSNTVVDMAKLSTSVKTGFTNLQAETTGTISALSTSVSNGISDMSGNASGAVSNMQYALLGVIASMAYELAVNGYNAGSGMGNHLVMGINDYAGAASGAGWNLAQNAEQGAWAADPGGNGYQIGAAISNGVANGIYDYQSSAINAAVNMATSALNSAKSRLGIASPSKVFAEEVGKNAALGMAMGFNENLSLEVPGMVSNINQTMASPVYEVAGAQNNVTNVVKVYLGDRELSSVLSNDVIRNIGSNNRAFNASAGRR